MLTFIDGWYITNYVAVRYLYAILSKVFNITLTLMSRQTTLLVLALKEEAYFLSVRHIGTTFCRHTNLSQNFDATIRECITSSADAEKAIFRPQSSENNQVDSVKLKSVFQSQRELVKLSQNGTEMSLRSPTTTYTV